MTNSDNPNTKHREYWDYVDRISGIRFCFTSPQLDKQNERYEEIHLVEHGALTALESELKGEKIRSEDYRCQLINERDDYFNEHKAYLAEKAKVKELLEGIRLAAGFVSVCQPNGPMEQILDKLIAKYEVPNE